MGSIFRKREGQPFTLLCQAQSYPAPVFRQVFFFLTSQNLWPPKHQLFQRTLVAQLLYATSDKVSDYCVKHRPFPYPYSGKFVVRFVNWIGHGFWKVQLGFEFPTSVTLRQVNMFSNFYVEPIGSAAPSITTTQKAAVSYPQHSALALLCPAQGFPVPVSRCVNLCFSCLVQSRRDLQLSKLEVGDIFLSIESISWVVMCV